MFEENGAIFRRINESYLPHFDRLLSSGLYDELTSARLLVAHEPASAAKAATPSTPWLVIRPERVRFISYPYEWSFSELKDAALATLEVQKRALSKGMVLKDASAYNIQFLGGKPILIDTLSFEEYHEGAPWIAYGQFCRHFLAPLALMALVDIRLGSLMRVHIDGVPLDLAARLLGSKTAFRMGLLTHIGLHAKASNRAAGASSRTASVSRTGMLALVENLKATIESLNWKPSGTEWADYYQQTNYDEGAMSQKRLLVQDFIRELSPIENTCWDLGANNAEFSLIAAAADFETVAWDIDPAAVEQAYLRVKGSGEKRLLPLLLDLTNPSPSQGWASHERSSLDQRGHVGFLMALALIHHLAIGNNVPLGSIAKYFASLSNWAIVEFVPKADSQVARMLADRKDIFGDYDESGFEDAFTKEYRVVRKEPVQGTARTLYLLQRRSP